MMRPMKTPKSRKNAPAFSRHKQPAAEAEGMAPRRAALAVLKGILAENLLFDDVFERATAHLNPRDQSLCHALVGATLRGLRPIDKVITRLMERPFRASSTERMILQLGMAQLYYLDGIKPHAAISTSVDLTRLSGCGQSSGVINGVLRSAQRQFETLSTKPEDAVPTWLALALQQADPSGWPGLAAAMLARAPLDVRLRPSASPETRQAYLALGAPLPQRADVFRLPVATDPAALPGLAEGEVYIQDAGAQLPADVLTRLLATLPALPAGPVLDVCAAPGGKTLQLADGLPVETNLVALDINPRRIGRLRENLHRCGASRVPVVVADGGQLPFAAGSCAAVLLDAPCTATGTTRRHPEVLHLRQPADVTQLVATQRALLREAARVLAPGGVLVYAVCSLLPAEGEAQQAWAAARLPGAGPVKLESAAMAVPPAVVTEAGALRLRPDSPDLATDGFFIAAFTKARPLAL